MTITIITPTLNAGSTIGETLASLVSQTVIPLELLVIDGGSTDETLSILTSFSSQLPVRIIQAKEPGIYEAMNQGVAEARGDIVAILNADDYYIDATVLEQVRDQFLAENAVQVVYGDIQYIDRAQDNRIVRIWRPGVYSPQVLARGWSLAHPAVFVHRSVYTEFGVYDTRLRVAADYALSLRWFLDSGIIPVYIPRLLVTVGTGGFSARSLVQRVRTLRECVMAWELSGHVPPRWLLFRRVWYKIPQWLHLF